MIFDDYLWKGEDGNILKTPKLAIDSFVNIFSDKIYIIRKHLYQLYLIKTENKELDKFFTIKIVKKLFNLKINNCSTLLIEFFKIKFGITTYSQILKRKSLQLFALLFVKLILLSLWFIFCY